jgi:hypothetical protein
LQVGQAFGRLGQQALELGPACHAEAQHVDQVGIVFGKAAEQGDDVAGNVVDRLGPGAPRAAQEDAAHAHEGLGIAGVGRGLDDGADAAGKIAFSTDVTGRGRNGANENKRGRHGGYPARCPFRA